MSRSHIGLILTIAGTLLVIVAFFSPWLDVFKLNDPSFHFLKQGYSPWMVLGNGRLGTLGMTTWAYLLLILAMTLSSLALALAHAPRIRSRASLIARILAVASLVMIVVSVPAVILDLSFFWPYLNVNLDYGVYLAGTGTLSVLVGITISGTKQS
ncbi:MAG TPA: hypothetical protein VKQ30_20045 [Ktedonobacterales bacterium]|nr:hypothetical protein [Ktedonobacterales bacterium]